MNVHALTRSIALTAVLLAAITAGWVDYASGQGGRKNPAAAETARGDEQKKSRLWSELYRLIWPRGRFEGNLDDIVRRSTQKSASLAGAPRLYVTHYTEGVLQEWQTARGGVDPVYCARDKRLVYRRANGLEQQVVRLGGSNLVAHSPPAPIENIEVTRLHVCVDSDEYGSILWVSVADGRLRQLAIGRDEPRWLDDVKINAPEGTREGTSLHIARAMQGLRPNGVLVSVSDHRLVGEDSKDKRKWLIKSSPYLFFGYPVWIKDSDLVVVNASLVTK